jgi:predicted DsbA family dithiol-disulfide isomerase
MTVLQTRPGPLVPVSTFEVFADVVCPFAYVGLRRLMEIREARHRPDVRVRIRAWPLELVNGEPLDATLVSEKVDALRATVAPELFEHFDASHFPQSAIPALSLAAYADHLDPVLGERVSLELRQALFDEGRDIGDEAVLALVAERCGIRLPDLEVWRSVVIEDWHEGIERGVKGSPHVFAAQGAAGGNFCPLLTIARVDGRLSIEWNQGGIARMEACLSA